MSSASGVEVPTGVPMDVREGLARPITEGDFIWRRVKRLQINPGMWWNYLGISQNVLGRQQGCHVGILQSDVPRDQDNRSIKKRFIRVSSKEKTTDGTGDLQTYHSPQWRLRASGAYFGESYATNSIDSDTPR